MLCRSLDLAVGPAEVTAIRSHVRIATCYTYRGSPVPAHQLGVLLGSSCRARAVSLGSIRGVLWTACIFGLDAPVAGLQQGKRPRTLTMDNAT
jgi:hypothetical protein